MFAASVIGPDDAEEMAQALIRAAMAARRFGGEVVAFPPPAERTH